MKVLNKIKNWLYAIEITISVIIVVLIFFIAPSSNLWIRRKWTKMQRFLIGYKIDVIGSPDPRANMIIANHQSMLDIMALEEIHPANICWIAKKEIEDLPFFGNIIRVPKMISIDRKDPRSLPKIIKLAKERVSEGRVIAIFPEGTRGDGDKILKFKSGANIIADKLNLVVQPVLIIGSRKIIDSKTISVHSGSFKVIYMDIVDTSDENWLENTRAKMQTLLAQNLDK
ncbi:1-acyl-sn-glycerol-3-phosphate acyltransferase [Campylobacter devanensis]|uniref:1-acyl-sn-glycerol-3-phosphate acyltransferase n=1 Tax=Campylobacter devanensis TaxID=3161138 RepID=A0A1X9SSI1_9BACT|nr:MULTISPECIES: lysophospholipid acyltransferase family protein [Campylobacter]ARQ99148.1 1-acylglycerol-3-phosphate O-acyltransferase [Campylobacter lanienae]SUX02330.1 1-acyl-sn-glycerol-3-phosphate acyltransferase [Campylobacter lanienae]